MLCRVYSAVSFISVYVLCIARAALEDDIIYDLFICLLPTDGPVIVRDETERSAPQRKCMTSATVLRYPTGHSANPGLSHVPLSVINPRPFASCILSLIVVSRKSSYRMSFKGHTVVITGAGGGLGKA